MPHLLDVKYSPLRLLPKRTLLRSDLETGFLPPLTAVLRGEEPSDSGDRGDGGVIGRRSQSRILCVKDTDAQVPRSTCRVKRSHAHAEGWGHARKLHVFLLSPSRSLSPCFEIPA